MFCVVLDVIILVTSNSGHGKTTFCKKLVKRLACSYFNADDVRRQTKNADFSMAGRKLAAQNMITVVNQSFQEHKVVDMICPTKELRKILAPDVIVFIDSGLPTKYQDTASIYEIPTQEECRKLFVAKFDAHKQTVDELISWLNP